jgi:CheY-like chemotaxis protein
MSRHFFDLESDTLRYVDTEGTELEDAATIRSEALRFLASVFKDAIPEAGRGTLVVKVRDQRQRVILKTTLTLQEDWIENTGIESASSQGLCVLVVEDERLARMHAMDVIADAGFKAVEACNADEAIAILEVRPDIQVMFTEVLMPGSMNGLQLARYVRDRWPPIKIIATSGGLAVSDDQLPEGGVFLPKPYTRHRVATAIREFTGQIQQRRICDARYP